MTALIFSLGLFLFYGLVGFSVLVIFSSLRTFQLALVSPAFGLCVIILPVFFLNRWGLPVQDFATAAAIALAMLSSVLLAVKRPTLPLSDLAGIAAILVAALVLIGRPLLSFGFDWVSYANDDMANYCMNAARFLTNGYLTPPNLDDLFAGKDYAQSYWAMQYRGIRSGPELMLALVWGATKLNAHQIFMPTIIALQLALIAAAAGIVAGFTKENRGPLITAGLLAVSPLATLAVLYQLLAQIGGVAILCAAVALLCQRPPAPNLRSWLATSIIIIIVIAGLLVWYPESTPFIGVGIVLYLIAFTYREPKEGARLLAFYVFSALVALAILNTYAMSALSFVMREQVSVGFGAQDYALFPYFLVPSGISAFWGLTPMASLPREPFLSLAILTGIGLFIMLLAILGPQLKGRSPAAIFCALMLVVGVVMFFKNADYGLFKLSMFLQPFVAGVIATTFVRSGIPAHRKLAFVLVLMFCNAAVQTYYVNVSYGRTSQSTLADLQGASENRIYQQFAKLFDEARQKFPSGVLSDTPSPVIGKYQAIYSRGLPTFFITSDFFGGLIFTRDTTTASQISEKYFLPTQAQAVVKEIAARQDEWLFEFKYLNGNTFRLPKDFAKKRHGPLIVSSSEGMIFNKYDNAPPRLPGLHFTWAEGLKNYLIFMPSSLGNYYYGGAGGRVSFYQLEWDPMFPGQILSSFGRHFLFMVRGATQKPRLVMELTSTVVKQFDSELPRATANQVNIPFVGRGSARMSAPVPLVDVDDVPFLSINFGRDGKEFPFSSRSWMMSLYGRSINLDWRTIVTFGRNISLISEEEYRNFATPANLQSFPTDLANSHLEYSGIYEDGWISEHVLFFLKARPTDRSVRVKELVPLIDDKDFKTKLRILVDGQIVEDRILGVGRYDIRVPVVSDSARHKIELVWDRFQRLPGDDGRPTAGQISFIGYDAEVP